MILTQPSKGSLSLVVCQFRPYPQAKRYKKQSRTVYMGHGTFLTSSRHSRSAYLTSRHASAFTAFTEHKVAGKLHNAYNTTLDGTAYYEHD